MNILVINAFGTSNIANTRFANFCNLIKSIFKKVSEKSGVDNFYYTYRTPSTLGDFIYTHEFDPNSGTKENLHNKRNFDKMDMIFIDGTEMYLPWEEKGMKLSLFISLCKTANKCLYAGGVAMQALIYYLSTSSHNEYNFINSKGEIQAIEEIENIPTQFLNELKKNDYFLDFVTGDILEYRSIAQKWIPILNIGLHKQIVAEKYMNRGRFVLPENFQGKDYIKNANAISSNCKELKVFIRRQNLSHYLVSNLPIEFVAYSTLSWFPHFVNVSFQKFQFKVICECEKGPLVIEHENSVGVAFHPQSSYKESVILLENFIKTKFMQEQEKLFKFKEVPKCIEDELPLMFRNYKINDETRRGKKILVDNFLAAKNSVIGKINYSRPYSRVRKFIKDVAHVGFGFNNRDMIFVDNNSIIQKPVFNKKKRKFLKEENAEKKFFEQQFKLKRNENTKISQIFKDDVKKDCTKIKLEHNELLTDKGLFKAKELIDKNEDNALDFMTFIDRNKMNENQLITFYKRMRRGICQKLDEISKTEKIRDEVTNRKNNNLVLKAQAKKSNREKAKSYFSKTRSNFFKKSQNAGPFNDDNYEYNKRIPINSAQNTININTESNYNNKYYNATENNSINNEHQQLEEYNNLTKGNSNVYFKTFSTGFYNRNIKNIKNDLKKKNLLDYRYKNMENTTPEQRARREFLESKKKWICKEDFHRVFGIRTTSVKPVINIIGAGAPVTDYKYRDIHPDKWLTPNGFV